jgi:hypothetical protein
MLEVMNVRGWILLGVLSTTGCSDDTAAPEPAEFAALCGEVGPVQILALDPDRPLARVLDRGLFGERRVLDVGYLAEDASLPILVSGATELWSVGPCGEDPLKIAEGEWLRLVTYPEVWPDMLLACDREETGHISTIDPTGVRPANVVFETHECFARQTDDGLLTILPHDEETGALVLQPWPEDPWTMKSEPIVILDPVRLQVTPPHAFPTEWEVLTVTDDDYFALTPNDELVAISRIDAEITTIATDVYVFDTDSTGRYVVWQSLYVVNDDPEWPKGPIIFLDRQTGEETLLLGEGGLYTTFSPFSLASLGILQLQSSTGSSGYFYRLPTLEPIEMPGGVSVWGAIDETRVLVSGPWHRGPYRLFDTVTLELTELYDGSGQTQVRPDDNHMLVLDGVDCCTDENSTRKAGRLMRVSFDGEVDLLARRAALFYQFTTDGRVITTVDRDTNLVGSLIVVDPDTLDEYLVSDSVLGVTPTAEGEIEGDPIVSYTVIDPERQGVWLARLAD